MGKRASELDPSTMEEDRPHLMNHLYITWMAGCVLFVVLEEGKQCDALGDVQLGNLHHCGCYFNSYRLAKLFCRPCTPFYGNNIQLDNATCQKAKVFRKL